MKRLLALLLALCLVFAFAACGNKDSGDIDKESDTKTEQKVDKEDKDDKEEEEEFSIIGTWDASADCSDVMWALIKSELSDDAAACFKRGKLKMEYTYKFTKNKLIAEAAPDLFEKLSNDLIAWFDIDALLEYYAKENDMDIDDFKEKIAEEKGIAVDEIEDELISAMLESFEIYLERLTEFRQEYYYELDGNKLYNWEIDGDKSNAECIEIDIVNNRKFKISQGFDGGKLELVCTKR